MSYLIYFTSNNFTKRVKQQKKNKKIWDTVVQQR